jgi:hypothetical protein
MAANRKAISASLRWQVFARDNFTCRYCGAQAGQDGVSLAADHLISVADGGTNAMDNLITACQKCNGGKGARSLVNLPAAGEVAERMQQRAQSIRAQANAMRKAMKLEKLREQEAVNLKCQAYGVESVRMNGGEVKHIISLCQAYGAENVLNWYQCAAVKRVSEWNAIKYIYGIVRNLKRQAEEESTNA